MREKVPHVGAVFQLARHVLEGPAGILGQRRYGANMVRNIIVFLDASLELFVQVKKLLGVACLVHVRSPLANSPNSCCA